MGGLLDEPKCDQSSQCSAPVDFEGQQPLGEGWPWHTTVFVPWDATATLLNGDDSYFNRGLHVITMRWGKVYALDVFEDSQEVARGLAAQAAAGLEEAVAEKIVS